jgi:hypothetical protein
MNLQNNNLMKLIKNFMEQEVFLRILFVILGGSCIILFIWAFANILFDGK